MTKGFYSLCYHYIRNDYDDPLPRLFGTKINDFIFSTLASDCKNSDSNVI